MKNLIFPLLLGLLIFFPARAMAQEETGESRYKIARVGAGEVISRDYLMVEEAVEIEGRIEGDAYVAGGEVTLEGTITGDLLVVGGLVNIAGTVEQNVRVLGGQVRINGTIGGNVTVVAGNTEILRESVLSGNVVVLGGNLILGARVPGNIDVAGGKVTINSEVDGEIRAAVGQIRLGSNADIAGDVVLTTGSELVREETATVGGSVNQIQLPERFRQFRGENFGDEMRQAVTRGIFTLRLLSIASTLLLGYLLIHFLPNFSYRVIATIEERPGISAVTGIVALMVAPIFSLILLFSVVGTSLSLMLMALSYMTLTLAGIYFMYWLGARLLDRMEREASKTVTFIIGAALYFILSSLVFIGPVVWLAAMVLGTGALLLTVKRVYLSGRKLKLM